MIGQTIDARPAFPIAITALIVAAAALLALAVGISSVHVLLLAILPLCVAIALVFGRPQRVVLLVENDGLRLFHSAEKIFYRDIRAVTIDGRLYGPAVDSVPEMPLEIHCSGRSWVVPPVMNVSFSEFYRFLLSQLPKRPPRAVPAVLEEYVSEQLAKFGPAKVQLIHTREMFPETWRARRRRWIGVGLVGAGVIWFTSAMVVVSSHARADEYWAWLVAGVVSTVIGVVCWLWPRAAGQSHVDRMLKKHPEACVVIGPAGIAMAQAETKGALRWQEVTGVTTKVSQLLRTSRVAGMQLRVRGAEILILDIYEHSPREMAEMIRRNLEPGV